MRTTNGWPFRYFGMHTEAYSVLGELLFSFEEEASTNERPFADPHDSLYPRAKTVSCVT